MSVSKSIVWSLVATTAMSLLLVAVAGGQSPLSPTPSNVWSSLHVNTALTSSSELGDLAELDRELAAKTQRAAPRAPQVTGGPALTAPNASLSNVLPVTRPKPSNPSPGVPALPSRLPAFRSPGYVSLSSASTPAQLRPPVIPSRRHSSQRRPARPQAARMSTRSPKTNRPKTNPQTNLPAYRVGKTTRVSAAWSPRVSSYSEQVRAPRLLPSGSDTPRVASHPRRRVISSAKEEAGLTWIGSDEPWDVIYEDASFQNGAYGDAGFGLLPRRRRGWFAGAEYLLVRPHFSDARAFSRRDLAPPNSNPSIQTETTVDFEFGYESSLRTYVGYRLDDCCSEFRATYSRLRGHSTVAGTATTGLVQFTAFEINAVADGQTITANTDVTGDVYDFEISRCIRNGGTCGDCDSCGGCDTCGGGSCDDGFCGGGSCGGCSTCPAWDLTWSAGFRVADMGYDTLLAGPTTGGTGTLDIHMNFVGAGPIIGLAGNRHFGRARQFSIYADWNLALLLGHYDHTLTRTNVQALSTNITRFDADLTRVIPVTEIEMGVRWQPRPRLTVSAGWFMQVWWDLGMTEEEASSFDGLNFLRDDANIMSWDGLSVRAELMF